MVKLYPRIKYGTILLILMLIDIGPVPLTAMIALYIVLFRPSWFKNMVDDIY